MRARAALVILCVVGLASSAAAQSPWQDVIRNLRHPKAEERLNAIGKLNEAAYAPAAEAVAQLITDPDDRVQAAAIDAELTFFLNERVSGKSRAQEAFDAGPLIRGGVAAPAVVIEKLIACLRDENPRVRFDAVHALGAIAEVPFGADHTGALAAELDHYDPVIRAATARVLGRLRAKAAGPQLLVALEDSNVIVRQYAIEALGLVREERALAPLRGLFGRRRGDVVDVLLALARIGSREDIGTFRQRVTDRDPAIRRAAVEGLGRVGDRDSLDLLNRLLTTDRSAAVKLAAAFALHLLGQVESHQIAAMLSLRDLRAQASDYLFELGRDAVPGIAAALKVAKDASYRADLVQVLGYVGTADETSAVDAYSGDRDERVRRAAAAALIRLRRARPAAG